MFQLLAVVVLLLVLKWRPTVGGTERIELKFSLKIALEYWCLANKLHSEIRHVVAVQRSTRKSISDSPIFPIIALL